MNTISITTETIENIVDATIISILLAALVLISTQFNTQYGLFANTLLLSLILIFSSILYRISYCKIKKR